MLLPRVNWEAVKGWIAIATLVAAACGFYVRLDREVQARLTSDQASYLLDQKVSGFMGEVLRRLDRIERKLDSQTDSSRRR